MDEKQPDTDGRFEAAPARAPAAAFLDLWEHHVSYAALHGPLPPPRPSG